MGGRGEGDPRGLVERGEWSREPVAALGAGGWWPPNDLALLGGKQRARGPGGWVWGSVLRRPLGRTGGQMGWPGAARCIACAGPARPALSRAVVVGARRRGSGRRVHVGGSSSGSGCSGGRGCGTHGRVVMVMRMGMGMRVVAVATQAGQRVGSRPALGPEVVVVGGGRVLVGMVMQRLGRAGCLQAQLGVRGTGPACCSHRRPG